MHWIQRWVKRAIDIGVAVAALVVVSPLAGIIALAIMLTMGRPVLFRQPRLGYRGRPFQILKFRTMTDARDSMGALLPDSERLTPFGRWLRKTTLDELPEFINVLRGEMSLVGPRPLLAEYRDLYSSEESRRHTVRPGMAGPVLAGGRNLLDWDQKLAADLWYVNHWSLWLDVQILVQTMLRVIRREGVSAAGHATMPRFEGAAGRRGPRKDQL